MNPIDDDDVCHYFYTFLGWIGTSWVIILFWVFVFQKVWNTTDFNNGTNLPINKSYRYEW